MPKHKNEWISYVSDVQFDVLMWLENHGATRVKEFPANTLRCLERDGFVSVENGFARLTLLMKKLIKKAAEREERGDD